MIHVLLAPPSIPKVEIFVDGVSTQSGELNVGQKATIACTSNGGNPSPTLSILVNKKVVSMSLGDSQQQTFSYSWIANVNETSWVVECQAENSAADLPVHSEEMKLSLKCK